MQKFMENLNQFEDIAPDKVTRKRWDELIARTQNGLSLYGRGVGVGKPIQSTNYKPGVSGYLIDTNGNAEFNDGTFRGTFNIGGTNITINNTEDIQTYLNIISLAGGGTLYLQNGTYTLTSDVSIPEGVRLKGVSRDGVILDGDGSFGVKIVGSDAYTTGTITIANGGDEVVGSGTTFTSAMVGRFILLGEGGDYQWYEISAFTDTTHIDISTPYTGPSLSGDSYTIATINTAAAISTLTITNTAVSPGLKIQYAMEPLIDDIIIYDCGTGLDFDQVVYPLMYVSSIENGVNWNANEVSGYEVKFSVFDDSTTGAGIIFTKVGTSTFFDSSVRGNTGDGINMTDCNFNAMIAMDVSSNGGQGIELVSNCNDNQFIAVGTNDNTSDGYKLTATSDRNVISNSTVKDNGGFGINIAAATCDGNIISSPAFSNNSSGNINDSGTGTIIQGDDTAYASSWNGNLGTPTKNAVYDKIESLGGGIDVQIFTSSDTWTKPAGAQFVQVVVVGAGGGGGSGRKGAASSDRYGGAGGGGGAATTGFFNADDLGSTETVTVGVGGAGGASQTSNDTNGSVGGNGTGSSFGTWLFAGAGGGGAAGGTGAGNAGGGGSVINNAATSTGGAPVSTADVSAIAGQGVSCPSSGDGLSAEWGGATGGKTQTGDTQQKGGSSIFAGAGGGAGGKVTSGNTYGQPNVGGRSQSYTSGGGGAAGVSQDAATAGTDGAANSVSKRAYGGAGGGGGGASKTQAGGAGGAGGLPGGGGGGGGGSTNSVGNSGAGGTGGAGLVKVITYF